MRKELSEGMADFIRISQTPITPNSGGWHKNIIRGVRADGADVESSTLNRANKQFEGVEGTKGYHDSNRAFLKMTPKEDKVGKRSRKFRKVKNGLGREVRQGYMQIVKKVV